MSIDPENVIVGVIGGSGLYSIKEIQDVKEFQIETPYGQPSDLIRVGTLSGVKVVFLARHGRHHSLTPSEIPYQANIWAMKSLGVKWIISASAVGSLKQEIKPLDIVIPDQFIDNTHDRPFTFFGEGAVAHVSLAEPFCSDLSDIVFNVSNSLMPKKLSVHRGGTYLCMEGPAFSTRAESKLYKGLGCSIIGMTNHTEARLAREAEIAYTTLAMSTDYDCWHEDYKNVTIDMIISNLNANAELASKIISKSINQIGSLCPPSIAHEALKDALITAKENVPKKTRKKINLFTKKYWGDFISD